jgi:hypothetical protein
VTGPLLGERQAAPGKMIVVARLERNIGVRCRVEPALLARFSAPARAYVPRQ